MDGINATHIQHGSSRSYSSVLVDPPTTVHLIDDVDDDTTGPNPIGRNDGLLGDSILTENEDSYRTTMNKTRDRKNTIIDNGHFSIGTTEQDKGSMKKSNVLYGSPASAAGANNNNNNKKFRTYHYQTIQEEQQFPGTEFTDKYRRVIDDDDYDADCDLHNSRHDDKVHGLISSFHNALDQFSHQYTNAVDLVEQPALTSSNDRSSASRTTGTKPASIMAQTPLAPTRFQLHSTPRPIESKARTTKGSATTVSSYMTVENNKLQASAVGRGIRRQPQQYTWEQHLQDPTRSPPRPVETPLTTQRSTRRSMDKTTIIGTTKDADAWNYKPFLAADHPSMNKPSITDPSTIRKRSLNRSTIRGDINQHEPDVKESSSLSAIVDELRWTIECQNIELDLLRHGARSKHDSKHEATTKTYDSPFHDHNRDHYHDANGIDNGNRNHSSSDSRRKYHHQDHGSNRFGKNENFVDEREGSSMDWNDKVRPPYDFTSPDDILRYDLSSRRRSSSSKTVRNDFAIYDKGNNTTTTTTNNNNNHEVPTATDGHIFSPGTRHVANILRHMKLDDDHFVPLTEIIDRHWNRRFEEVVDSTKKR